MTYDETQGKISEAWLALKERSLRSQLAAALNPDDRNAADAAKDDRKEFLSLASSYIAWELPRRSFTGIPPLDSETQVRCNALYAALEQGIPAGSSGADRRLAVMEAAQRQASASDRVEDSAFAGLLNQGRHYTRATAPSLFTEKDASRIMSASALAIQSLANPVSPSRQGTEIARTPPSPDQTAIDEMAMRINNAQHYALKMGYSAQPHEGNLDHFEARMRDDELDTPSLPDPGASRHVSLSRSPSVVPQSHDMSSSSARGDDPELVSSPPAGSPSREKRRRLQGNDSEPAPDRSAKRPQLDERDRTPFAGRR